MPTYVRTQVWLIGAAVEASSTRLDKTKLIALPVPAVDQVTNFQYKGASELKCTSNDALVTQPAVVREWHAPADCDDLFFSKEIISQFAVKVSK